MSSTCSTMCSRAITHSATKKEIRAFFNQVRQEFLDWHGTVYGTPEFAAQETKLTDLYRSKVTG